MKLLLIGSGGREHALAQILARSPMTEILYVAPGNAGFLWENLWPKIELINAASLDGLRDFALQNKIDLTIVGPDQMLADGIVDLFEKEKLKIFGPTREAAKLEWSKGFAKKMMKEARIPTADFYYFENENDAKKFLETQPFDKQLVIKVDGLALGKGVVIADNVEMAKNAVTDFASGKALGFKAESLVIEEKLTGPEVSFFYLCDGLESIYLAHACDYKRLRDGNEGPNTGGMGAYAFPDWVTKDDQKFVSEKIVLPTLQAMMKRNTPFKGVLFVGLMKTKEGLKVLEYNARFGDPETQGILPLLGEDLLPWLLAVSENQLGKLKQKTKQVAIKKREGIALHLVFAADGYPGTEGKTVQKGDRISLNQSLLMAIKNSSAHLFFAGVKKEKDELVTNGGRVLGLTVIANSLAEARKKLYALSSNIEFKNHHYRKDIGGSNQA